MFHKTGHHQCLSYFYVLGLVVLLALMAPFGVHVVEGRVLTFGSLGRVDNRTNGTLANNTDNEVPLTVSEELLYITSQGIVGIDAAFYEANVTRAIDPTGGTNLSLVVRDVLASPGGLGLGESMIEEQGVDMGFLLVSSSAIRNTMAEAVKRNMPIVGGFAVDESVLSPPQAINGYATLDAEFYHLHRYALNSHMRCVRASIATDNDPSLHPVVENAKRVFAAQGLPEPLVVNISQNVLTDPEQRARAFTLMDNDPQCIFFFSSASMMLPAVIYTLHQHPFFDSDSMYFLASSIALLPNFTAATDQLPTPAKGSQHPNYFKNLYFAQQFPDPQDDSYLVVRKYKNALQQLKQAHNGQFGSYGRQFGYTVPLDEYNYFSLAGYIMARLAIDVLKKTRTSDFTAAGFLDTVYNTKFFSVDELPFGPYLNGCLGNEEPLTATGESVMCHCNNGNRLVFTARVDTATVGGIVGVKDDDELGQEGIAVTRIPPTICHVEPLLRQMRRPFLFVQLIPFEELGNPTYDSVSPEDRQLFTAALRKAFRYIEQERVQYQTTAISVALEQQPLTYSTTASGEKVFPYGRFNDLKRRYNPMAFIGTLLKDSFYNPSLGMEREIDRRNVTIPMMGRFLPQRLPLVDPPLTEWRRSNIEVDPVLADYVHSLVALMVEQEPIVSLLGGANDQQLKAVIFAASDEELQLGIKSCHTFGVQPDARLVTSFVVLREMLLSVKGEGYHNVIIIGQEASYIEQSLTFALYEKSSSTLLSVYLRGLRVYVATSEEIIHYALNTAVKKTLLLAAAEESSTSSSGSSRGPKELALSFDVYFASVLGPWWSNRSLSSSESSAGGGQSLVASFYRLFQPTGVPHPSELMALRLGYILQKASEIVSGPPSGSDLLLDSVYAAGILSTHDISLGRFSSRACPQSVIASNEVDRECQCSKGARTFNVHSLAGLLLASQTGTTDPHPELEISYTYTMGTCGVKHTSLAPSASTTLEIPLGVGFGALLFVALLVLLFAVGWYRTSPRRRHSRNLAAAPKNENDPFTIVFTDIESSTSLWAKIPEEMSEAIEIYHLLVRDLLTRYQGHEVKTAGDSFMIAFCRCEQAVEFAADLQVSLHDYNWGRFGDSILNVYLELAVNHSGKTPQLPDNPLEVPGCWTESSRTDGGDNDQKKEHISRSLQVRVGLHTGKGTIRLDPTTKRYDYDGTVVSTAARLEDAGHGGQILISDAVLASLKQSTNEGNPDLVEVKGLAVPVDIHAMGTHVLKGHNEPTHVFQVLPTRFKGRTFPPLRVDVSRDDTGSAAGGSSDEQAVELLLSPASRCAPQDFIRFAENALAGRYATDAPGRESHRKAVSKILHNFAFLKALLSTCEQEQRRAILAKLADRWYVSLEQSSAPLSKSGAAAGETPLAQLQRENQELDFLSLLVAIRVAPVSEEVFRDDLLHSVQQTTGSLISNPAEESSVEIMNQKSSGPAESVPQPKCEAPGQRRSRSPQTVEEIMVPRAIRRKSDPKPKRGDDSLGQGRSRSPQRAEITKVDPMDRIQTWVVEAADANKDEKPLFLSSAMSDDFAKQ